MCARSLRQQALRQISGAEHSKRGRTLLATNNVANRVRPEYHVDKAQGITGQSLVNQNSGHFARASGKIRTGHAIDSSEFKRIREHGHGAEFDAGKLAVVANL